MIQKKIFVPTQNKESWKELLAEPEKHWKKGYSAMSVATSWENENDIPKTIKECLVSNDRFQDIELLFAVPEYKVTLPGGNRPSQNDVFFIAGNSRGLISCTVEAKAREDFDELMGVWYNDPSRGKKERLDFLQQEIGFPTNIDISKLRYQLFHRLASAVIMANKFHARDAMMIIQSFVEDDTENHFEDFHAFVRAYGVEETPKAVPILLTEVEGIKVYVMWVYTDLEA